METPCAYVTLLMRNDAYLPGALVLAHALRLYTKHDLVCLVTGAVSAAAAGALRLLYDRVICIEETVVKHKIHEGRRDRDSLLTRFAALRLGPDGDLGTAYARIILLDADVLPLDCMDSLFLLPAPAGILMEKREYCFSYDAEGRLLREADARGQWRWHAHYGPVAAHGEAIPAHITRRVLTDPSNMGVNAALWRLDPSLAAYEELRRCLEDPEILELATARFPWPEMQLATLLWSGRWTNIDMRWCSIGGYPDLNLLAGTHYAGLKPWQLHRRCLGHYAAFPDFQLWHSACLGLLCAYPQLRRLPMLERLHGYFLKKPSTGPKKGGRAPCAAAPACSGGKRPLLQVPVAFSSGLWYHRIISTRIPGLKRPKERQRYDQRAAPALQPG